MAGVKISIDISDNARTKAKDIKKSLRKKRIVVNVREVYALMLEKGVDKVNEKNFI